MRPRTNLEEILQEDEFMSPFSNTMVQNSPKHQQQLQQKSSNFHNNQEDDNSNILDELDDNEVQEKMKKKIVIRDENTERISPPRKHRLHENTKTISTEQIIKYQEKE